MPRLSKIGAAALAAFGWTSGVSTVSATYLVVAGGGGGGSGQSALAGGGGGAGGLLSGTTTLNPTLSYTVTVGAGGTGAVNITSNSNTNGSNSVFNAITSTGGGAGGTTGTNAGQNGGSGGGGSAGSAAGTGTSGQGNAGGVGQPSTVSYGGGGGGASAAGTNGSNAVGGTGGAGTASSITGSSVTYAGGGGGGLEASGTQGAGGAGGGGTGNNGAGTNGTSGTANLGGGGGGAGKGTGGASITAGNGGSGIVIISYAGAQQFGGGVVTSVGGNTIHTFTTSGTLGPITPLSASYLVVAGGGGAGTYGGGGAGGLLSGSGLTIDPSSTYLVTVGAGGIGDTTDTANGTSGTSSSFLSLSSAGGGGGAYPGAVGSNGGSGGGGGGGTTPGNAGGSGNTPSTSPSQGNNGGRGLTDNTTYTAGGGGGGAGAVGSNAASQAGGAGGAGTASSISGTSTTYAGGGGGRTNVGTSAAGGAGGGGQAYTSGTKGGAGTANTGGGGGGGAQAAGGGGNGGSGVVIISYAGTTQQMAGGTVTITGGNVIHTFTSSGYLTPIKYVNNSLRFRNSASAYLNRTPTVASDRRTWTWSGWVKRGLLNTRMSLMGGYTGTTNGTLRTDITILDGAALNVGSDQMQTATDFVLQTTQLFRDPAAWYHIVVAMDTTQATSTNRVKIYVNGVQVTAFSTATYPSLNYQGGINFTNNQYINRWFDSSGGNYYGDGYLTEVNFIDGQALTPNSFGTFNSYGVWQPITYGGSYGTNGFYLPFSPGSSTYGSNFNGSSQSLSGTLASAIGSGNFTIEMWVNQSTLTNYQDWFSITRGAGGFNIGTDASGLVVFYSNGARQIQVSTLTTNKWNHIAFVRNGTTITAYLNGASVGTATVSTNFSSTGFFIGSLDNTQEWLNAVMSNLRLTNTAVYTSNFTPSTAPLTAVSGTMLLTLQSSTIVDNSGNSVTISNTGSTTSVVQYPFNLGFAKDQSPNANNWALNNISAVNNSTLDYMTDVPTLTSATAANYAVLNPLSASSYITLSGANLNTQGNTATDEGVCGSTIAVKTGKFYVEFVVTGSIVSNRPNYGIIPNPNANFTNGGAQFANTGGMRYGPDGKVYTSGSLFGTFSTFTTNDIISIAVDADNGAAYVAKNGTWQNSGVPTSGSSKTGAVVTWTGGAVEYFICVNEYNGTTSATNFGQRPFTYTPPSGFVALNTYNL